MRRRSPRVVWLPVTNANSVGNGNVSQLQTFVVGVAGTTGDSSVGEIPLVIDAEVDPLGATTSLADVENNGYRLRRIVGKIWCRYDQDDAQNPTGIPRQVAVTAAFIIRRTNPAVGTSIALQTGDADLLHPQHIENSADPWIWRRSWILHNNLVVAASLIAPGLATNWIGGTGGNSDGPHVDQKTARLVGAEERLFLDVGVTILVPGTNQAQTGNVTVVTDIRVLGSMRTNVGNRRNASR